MYKLSEFILDFGKIYFVHRVQSMLALEIFTGKDADKAYLGYVHEFRYVLNFYDKHLSNRATVQEGLKKLREKRLSEAYDELKKRLCSDIQHFKVLQQADIEKIVVRLQDTRSLENFNWAYLTEVRKLKKEILGYA